MRGHIRKRGDKWCIVVYVGVDELGKRKYKWISGFTTRKAAEKALPDVLKDYSVRLPTSAVGLFSEHLQSWLEYKRERIRHNSYKTYEQIIRLHIIPHIGQVKIEQLTAKHLQELYRKLKKKGLSNRYILQVHTVIRDSLDRALKWDMVSRNVAEAAEPPQVERKTATAWPVEVAQAFLEHPETRKSKFYGVYVLALTTGMREGEILGLRWQDIDFSECIIHVRQQLVRTVDGFALGPVKSESGVRDIAVPYETMDVLRTVKAQQAQNKLRMGGVYKDEGYVFAQPHTGRYIRHWNVQRSFARLIERIDYPPISLHGLRHTHASFLLQMGESVKVVQDRLGHSNFSTTMDTYAHVMPKQREKTADQVAAALFRDSKISK